MVDNTNLQVHEIYRHERIWRRCLADGLPGVNTIYSSPYSNIFQGAWRLKTINECARESGIGGRRSAAKCSSASRRRLRNFMVKRARVRNLPTSSLLSILTSGVFSPLWAWGPSNRPTCWRSSVNVLLSTEIPRGCGKLNFGTYADLGLKWGLAIRI